MVLNENSSMRDIMDYMNNPNLINEHTQLLTENKVSQATVALKKAFSEGTTIINSIPIAEITNNSIDKAKEGIANIGGFAKEQWNDKENQAKLKEVAGDIQKNVNELQAGIAEFATNPKKLEMAIKTLSVSKFLVPILGIAWVFATSTDPDPTLLDRAANVAIDGFNFFNENLFGAETDIPDTNVMADMWDKIKRASDFVYLGILVWLMELAVRILSGAASIGSVVKGVTKFIYKVLKTIFSAIFKMVVFIIKKFMSGKKNAGNAPNDSKKSGGNQVTWDNPNDNSPGTYESYNPFEGLPQLA